MGFRKRDAPAGFEGNDIHMHIVTQVSGFNKPRCGPNCITIRHFNGCHIFVRGDKRNRGLDTFGGLIPFAHPMELRDVLPIVPDRPDCIGWNVGIATFVQHMALSVDVQFHRSRGHKDHRLCFGVLFWRVRATARRQLNRILGERFGKPAERARQDPHPHPLPLPAGQKAGDDIALGQGGDHRIGLRENGGAFGVA